MRTTERTRGLLRAPLLAWRVLARGRYDFVYDQMPVSLQGMSFAKRWNLFRAGANLLYRRAAPWSMPLHMQVELTNYCDLRCPVCPTGNQSLGRRPRTLEVDLAERVFGEVGPHLLTASLWGWGESLLHPRLAEILRVVRKHPVAVLVSTNGQCLDRVGVVDALLDAPPTYLIVAIDGLTDETNSRYRVGAKLAPALAGVRAVAEGRSRRGQQLPLLHMRTIVMKHNQHELPRLEEFAAEHRFDLLTVRALAPLAEEANAAAHEALLPEVPEFRLYEYEGGARRHRDGFVCQEPFWFPSLYADGTVVACAQDHNAERPLGSMADGGSFADLWYGRQAAEVRKAIRDRAGGPGFCGSCPARDRPTTGASVRGVFLNPKAPNPVVMGSP